MNQFSRCLIVTALIGTVASVVNAQNKNDLYKYVKPIIGTQKMGHTYPGATVPFGMVQLSPDTDTLSYEDNGKYNKDVYRYCAGYQYDDPTIVGFSHTHYSGTGHSDLGDFLVMPTVGKVQLNPGTATHPENGYRSKFSHQNEVAEANYYKVKLDDDGVLAELTTSARIGFHQYTFPKSAASNIILDLMHGLYNYDNKNVWTYVRVVNDSLVVGYRQTNGWAKNRTVYFAMSFSKPFKSYGAKDFTKKEVYKGFWAKFDQTKNFPELAARQIRMYFNFDTEEAEKVKIKFAISSVSSDNALMNMKAEIPGWDFNQVKEQGQQAWNKELQKIEVKTEKKEDAINFYTAMYHAFLSPTVYMDLNNEYKGLDQKIHQAKGFANYTTFSLWDTYRTLHPFFNIIQPQRNNDMVKSMLAHFDQSALPMLPIWSNSANDTWCMSGYHSVSVVADAIIKGNFTGDVNKALAACVATANQRNFEGIGDYIDKGYVPSDKNRTAVSNTLEYAYDDWCIAQLAKKIGNTEVYNAFIKRAENWRNVYDASIGFMRPRLSDGSFRKEFDVLETEGQGFIEGNAWNYSLYVPQNPEALIELMGGDKKFVPHLDSLFTMDLPDVFFAHTEDITREGIIGNYVHGNEPAHHVAYLYNYTSQPWKTQKTVRMILGKQYHNGPDGLGGNDDCGQMSAWYMMSSLGFYPMAPGSDRYELGSPSVLNASLNLENGKQFIVEAKNQSAKNVYVKQVLLNGKVLNRLYITHGEIVGGGKLTFIMASVPNKKSS
ncbi:glycoside hydrolase family 92 protein [Pedobacter hiemivivus]|uniref:Glycoside hydrolase family 92 protein n=1 Tax=Pedobacter hiemivivus TaxID=2530454 RepID=A0A4U1GK48_9SPHI|nr:GH92 family glycosyl hydrolase [Pedobacter hiemivivus]TCC99422.1 glycoside hydrolase family 92 protein [Pedobacter hiemivivus]TKC63729.1 glycoside hydrolase family 92 protein [Pedobacter hiemivivus]